MNKKLYFLIVLLFLTGYKARPQGFGSAVNNGVHCNGGVSYDSLASSNIGTGCYATGFNSFAGGWESVAQGAGSFAFGNMAQATQPGSFALGGAARAKLHIRSDADEDAGIILVPADTANSRQ